MTDALLCYTVGMTNHKLLTPEMLEDLSKMGDKDFAKKWGTSRHYPIRVRKTLGLKAFTNKHNKIDHKFIEDIEHKYCPNGGGHWVPIDGFTKCRTRYDGLAGICRDHLLESKKVSYLKNDGAKKARDWRKTPSGRNSLRTTWRKQKAKKDDAFVAWTPEHEINAYDLFDRSCGYCGIKVDFLKMEFDHFIPIVSGGKTEPGNMVPCCVKCNRGGGGKLSKGAWEWLQSKFGLERAGYIYNYCREKLHHLQMKHQNS